VCTLDGAETADTMKLLLVFSRAYPGRTLLMLACLLLAAVAEGLGLSTVLPLLGIVADRSPSDSHNQISRTVTDVLARIGLEPTLGTLLALIVAAMFVKSALVLVAQRQIGYTVAHVATDLRLELLRTLLGSRWSYYVRKPVGVLANAFATEASRASQAYLYGATNVALAIQATVYFCVALSTSWQATLGAAGLGVFTILLLNRLVRMTRRAGARQTRLLKDLLGRLTDILYAVKPLKAMARETLVGPLLEHKTQRLNRALQREVLSKEALNALHEPFLVATIGAGLYVAVARWGLPIDRVMLLALLFGRLLGHLQRMQKNQQRMVACDSAFWSIRQTIDEAAAESEPVQGDQPTTLTRAIALRDVTLRYGDNTVLDGASLEIPKGRVTVIVGPSGAGKTSIVDLVTGLVRPQSGEVYVDDLALASADVHAWRRKIGYVPQETFLLNETVATNVTLGDPTLDADDVTATLKDANAWDFVSAMPQGADTMVGEKGAAMSGGQRQRIAIARALAHEPELLILDEATASLDPQSEAEICATVRRLRGRMTVLAVSHQPALLDVADNVYRLEHGRAVEISAAAARGSFREAG
jgi:ATP-binding cassette subfamily C protein